MNAETLRRAAALMRKRAEAATPGPWTLADRWPRAIAQVDGPWVAETTALGKVTSANAEHIASWHPAVALAVADAFDQHADLHDTYDCVHEPCAHTTVARAYLGESA